MRLTIALFLPVLLLLGGCGDHPDKEPITRLFEDIQQDVQKKLRLHLRELNVDERRVRFFAEYHRDERVVIDSFLASSPGLTVETQRRVTAMRDAAADLETMHQALIDEGRFELTAEEQGRRDQLHASFMANANELAAIVDAD
jgi:hypothetical protein